MEKLFKVKIDFEVTVKKTIVQTISGNSPEEVKKRLVDIINSQENQKVISAESEEVLYFTKKWRDVEDVIFHYEKMYNENNNLVYKEDADNWRKVLKCLLDKDFDGAEELIEEMDTAPRGRCPQRLCDLFRALNI